MKQLRLDGTHLVLDTPYNPDEVRALKSGIPQARWDKLNKVWRIPLPHLKTAIDFAKSWNIEISQELIRLQLPDHPIGDTSIRLKNGKLIITLPYDTLTVKSLKTITGTKWNALTDKWEAPYSVINDIIKWADTYNIPIPDHIREQVEIETKQAQHATKLSQATDANITVPNIQLELYPYQRAGVAYAAEKQKCFIADEMGLGKSLQALATTEYTNQYPALIVCPSSLVQDWANKINEALPERTIQQIAGRKTLQMTDTDYTIIGYPNIHHHKTTLKDQNYNTLILDESHYCKNRTAQRTKAAKYLAKHIPPEGNTLLLTGTPITNRPAEYAPQLEILNKIDQFGGIWNFYKRYCNAYKDNWGHWQIHGASNLKELHNNLKTHCYIRREKQDVLPDLPPMTYNTITVEMSPKHKKEYNHALNDLQTYYEQEKEKLALQEGKNPTAARIRAHFATQNHETLIQLTELRKIVAQAKIKTALEWIQNANEQGHKIVIAAHHRHIVQTIANETSGLMIIGGQNPQKTETAKTKFQESTNPTNITISITAASHGHTLTAATNMLIIEPPWTPAQYRQTTARIHRIGQTQPVTIHNMLIPNTIDQHIYNTITKKAENTDPAISHTPPNLHQLLQPPENTN